MSGPCAPNGTVRGTLKDARVGTGGLAALAADVWARAHRHAWVNEGVNIAALAADIAD